MSDYTDYIVGFIGGISGTFGWSQNTLQFIVDEAVEEYGVSSESEMTDTKKAKALLRFKTMERLLMDTSTQIDYAADGESFKLSQVPGLYMEMWKQAKRDATPYLSSGRITLSPLDTGYSTTKRSGL